MSHKFWSPPKSLNAWQDWSLFDSTTSQIVHIGSHLSALHPKLFGLHGFFAGDKSPLAVTTTNSLIFKLVRALDSLCIPIYRSKGLSGMMIYSSSTVFDSHEYNWAITELQWCRGFGICDKIIVRLAIILVITDASLHCLVSKCPLMTLTWCQNPR